MTVAGDQIGTYRMREQIGAGGMGEVWLAEHALLGRRAAIKVLHPMYSGEPAIISRFFNEARAAASIADPGIVQIFDFGHDNGAAYLVMELLEGETLEARHRSGRLAIGDALRIVRQVAGSLGAAHARGIVHRDLKPENIFLVRDPEVPGGERAKILDFGVAKLADPQSGFKTRTAAMLGTPTYMSPEQCRGAGQVDQRSDIYSLGCVLYALIVGRPPFAEAGFGELVRRHLFEPAPAPSRYAVGVPPEIDRLVLRCLAKDPAERFASGRDLAVAISALIAGGVLIQSVPTVRLQLPLAPTPAPSTSVGAASSPVQPTGRRRFAFTAIMLVAAVVAATAVTTTSGGSRAASAQIVSPRFDAAASKAAVSPALAAASKAAVVAQGGVVR